MQYWLVKSEPDVWSLDQQERSGSRGATWDGVRNYQAANNIKKMKIGDLCYFYHSNIGMLLGYDFPIISSMPYLVIKKRYESGWCQVCPVSSCGGAGR